LVDIDGGKDLAMVLVEDVGKKGVYEISDHIKEKGRQIKEKKGDADHKQRTGIAKYLPAFVVTVLIKASNFLFHFLGINVKPLAVKKNQFGAACLTSVGMIGFKDATAPFTGYFMTNFRFHRLHIFRGIECSTGSAFGRRWKNCDWKNCKLKLRSGPSIRGRRKMQEAVPSVRRRVRESRKVLERK